MPEITYAEHKWVAAVTVDLPAKSARQAERRGSVRIPVTTKVDVLDVYCRTCRRPMSEVGDARCEISAWLHGGPIGTRKKRGGCGDEEPEVAPVTAIG